MSANPGQARAFQPLTPAVFHLLLALVDTDRHGYGIAKEVAERTSGRVRLGPGTIYGTLNRMLEAGLVEKRKSDARGGRHGDHRRRYYRITPLGRAVARAEARRLVELVEIARDKAVIQM
ncbi:MAG TPA: PadR family transcriptional regulator [Vicinamibacterales bacterium]|nr:PadR family transcriptional regulator [Vicinamibacterales bacterium]